MRLIDADELKNLPFERMIHTDFGDTAIPIEEIDNAPTVDMRDNRKETTFDDYLKEQLKDSEFRKEWEKLCDEDEKGRADMRGEENV